MPDAFTDPLGVNEPTAAPAPQYVAGQEYSLEQLPPEVQAAAKPQAPVEGDLVDVTPDANTLADVMMKSQGTFSLPAWMAVPENKARYDAEEPLRTKINDAWAIHKAKDYEDSFKEAFKGKSLGEATKTVAGGIGKTFKGFSEMVWGLGKHAAAGVTGGLTLAGVAAADLVGLGDPDYKNELLKQVNRRSVEQISGTDASVSGLIDMPFAAVRKVQGVSEQINDFFKLKAATDTGDQYQILAAQDEIKRGQRSRAALDLQRETQDVKKTTAIFQGEGAITQTLVGDTAAELKGGKVPVREEQVAVYAAGDPVAFQAFSWGLGAIGRGGQIIAKGATRAELNVALKNLRTAQQAEASAKAGFVKVVEPVKVRATPKAEPLNIPRPGEIPADVRPPLAEQLVVLPKAPAEALAAKSPIGLGVAGQEHAAKFAYEAEVAAAKGAAKAARAPLVESAQAETAAAKAEVVKAAENLAAPILPQAISGAYDRTATFVKSKLLGAAVGAAGVAAGGAEIAGKTALAVAPSGLTPQLVHLVTKFATATRKRAFEMSRGIRASDTTVLGPKSRFLWDATGALTDAVKGAGKGFFTLDLPLNIATAETPEERENPMLFGALFGGLHAGGKGLLKIPRGQEIDERNWGRERPYNDYKSDVGSAQVVPGGPTFDALTRAMMERTSNDPAQQAVYVDQARRVNAMRDITDASGAELHWIDEATWPEFARANKVSPDVLGARLWVDTPAGRKPVSVVRGNSFDVAPHEVAHPLQAAIGEQAMRPILAKLRAEMTDGQFESYGEGYVRDVLGKDYDAAIGWRENFAKATAQGGDISSWTPEQVDRLATRKALEERHAEYLDTIIKHGGPEMLESKGVLGLTARIIAGLAETMGYEPYGVGPEGKVSDVQKVPIRRETAQAVREHALGGLSTLEANPSVELTGHAKTPAATPAVVPAVTPAPKAPATPAVVPTVTPAPKAPATPESLVEKMPDGPKKIMAQQANEATARNTGLRVAYEHVVESAELGTNPSTDPRSIRDQRRSRIASGKDMEPGERVTIEEDLDFIQVLTDKKTPQWLVLRRDVVEANWLKFVDFAKGLNERQRTGLNIPAEFAGLDQAAQDAVFKNLKDFAYNRGLGRTGSGLEFPQDWSMGEGQPFYPPKTKPGNPVPMPQGTADFLNYLLGQPQAGKPGTAPVVRSKKTFPVDYAAMDLAEKTAQALGLNKPGEMRVSPEVRPIYGDQPGALALGISAKALKEVNPFRRQVNRVADSAKATAPSLIEASQRLNVENIVSVKGPVGESLGLGDIKTFATQAGFQSPKAGVESIRAAMIVDEQTGKKYTGMMHPWIREQIAEDYLRGKLAPGRRVSEVMDASIADKANMALKNEALTFASDEARFKDGYYTTEGRFLDRREALPVAREAGQIRREIEKGRDWLDSDDLNVEASFQSPKDLREMDMAKLQELRTYTTTAKHGTGGPTGLAYDIGLATKTADSLRELAENMREQRQIYAEGLAEIKSGKVSVETGFDALQPSSLKGQLFREAAEAATGTGSAGQYLRKKGYTDADFPMFGTSFDATPGAQFSPPGVGVGKEYTREELQKKWARMAKAKAKQPVEAEKPTEWTLLPAAPDSKAWILPDGTPMQLGGQAHHAGLKQVEEQYGITVPDYKGNDAAGVREQALTKGFVRVNQDTSGGQMAIELRAADLRKQRGAIEKIIEANLGKIDVLDITLFDKAGTEILDDASEHLFKVGETDKMSTALEMLDGMRGASFAAPKKGEDQLELFKSGGYPEAVRAREGDSVEYGIKNSPLSREAGSEGAAIRAFADRMVRESKEYAKDHVLKRIWNDGLTWYSRFVPLVKSEFGKDAPLFTQLLAGTSPRTSASVNFGFAYDAYRSFKDGRFDAQLKTFLEGYEMLKDDSWRGWVKENGAPKATPAGFMAQWIKLNDLKPVQTNGKLYGTHSARVLQILTGVWKQENQGPKTDQFAQNLLGLDHGATIDMWAARTMRRLGYEGFKRRWRILPKDETGVSDEDFDFSQAVYREAAKRLKLLPDALQGAFWIVEKQRWSNNHWADLDLGDFAKEIEDLGRRKTIYKEIVDPSTPELGLTVPVIERNLRR